LFAHYKNGLIGNLIRILYSTVAINTLFCEYIGHFPLTTLEISLAEVTRRSLNQIYPFPNNTVEVP